MCRRTTANRLVCVDCGNIQKAGKVNEKYIVSVMEKRWFQFCVLIGRKVTRQVGGLLLLKLFSSTAAAVRPVNVNGVRILVRQRQLLHTTSLTYQFNGRPAYGGVRRGSRGFLPPSLPWTCPASLALTREPAWLAERECRLDLA